MLSTWSRTRSTFLTPSSFSASRRDLRTRTSAYSAATKNALNAMRTAVAARRSAVTGAHYFVGGRRSRATRGEGERHPPDIDRGRAVAILLPGHDRAGAADRERGPPGVAAVGPGHARAPDRAPAPCQPDLTDAAGHVLPGDEDRGLPLRDRRRERVHRACPRSVDPARVPTLGAEADVVQRARPARRQARLAPGGVGDERRSRDRAGRRVERLLRGRLVGSR